MSNMHKYDEPGKKYFFINYPVRVYLLKPILPLCPKVKGTREHMLRGYMQSHRSNAAVTITVILCTENVAVPLSYYSVQVVGLNVLFKTNPNYRYST